jgi:16S rRNA A1518/A1519 N6-dimethyltransferase RsmA/KsgA/DIM1 with predicted DNA glycosylase/AP lyase activity
MAFNQRRKTLLNTLSSLSPQPHFKKNLETVIADSDISPSARPETLSPLQFIQLSTAIHKMLLLLASDT